MLLSDHADELKSAGTNAEAQRPASACFSLWRAAFVADRQAEKAKTLARAVAFPGEDARRQRDKLSSRQEHEDLDVQF